MTDTAHPAPLQAAPPEVAATRWVATASLIAVMIHAQKHEREIYNIKPGTEHEILKLGMNRQQS